MWNFTDWQMTNGLTSILRTKNLSTEADAKSTQPNKKKQRHHKDQRKSWKQPNATMEKHDQSSLRTRCWTTVIVIFMDMVTFIKVFMVWILRHRRHGDSRNPTHLMSQQLVLNTIERTPAPRDLLRNDSDNVDLFVNSSNWQSEKDHLNEEMYTNTHSHAHSFSGAIRISHHIGWVDTLGWSVWKDVYKNATVLHVARCSST